MILADKIITLRKKSGWSQEELAQQLHVTRQSVSKWETGQSVPDVDKLVRLADHGGALTTLADTVAGCCACSEGGSCVTSSFSMEFLRPATGSKIVCEATPDSGYRPPPFLPARGIVPK